MTLAEVYAYSPTSIWVGVVVLGLLVGSFLNVVILRLPRKMHIDFRRQAEEYLQDENTPKPENGDAKFGLAFPNSHCPLCKAPLKPWHNIPVLSYLFLKGQCAKCGVKISLRYPLIECCAALLAALAFWQFGPTSAGALSLILVWSLISLTMIDIDHHLLPDDITLPLMWLGVLANVFEIYTSLESSIIGAMAGYLSLWSVYWLFKLATGKEGMGFGDFKLLAALGAWMGWQYLPLIIILSSLVGAIIGIAGIVLMGKNKSKPIPFGPYLAIAGLIALIWGEPLLNEYLQFVNLSTLGK